MTNPWLMGIDLGGSGARCLLIHRNTRQVISAAQTWTFAPATGTFGTGFDLDLDQVWATVGQVCRDAMSSAGAHSDEVASLAVSAMRFSTVLVDADGTCLLAVPNRDARAAGECFELADSHGQALLQQTGSWPLPLHTSARLLYFKKQHPEQFKRIHTVFGIGEWLNQRLCGMRAIDPSQASASGLFSLHEKQWCWSLIDQLKLPRDMFPPVLEAGSKLGELTPEGASHLGLATGVTLAMGGADTQCGVLGSGVIAPGSSAAIVGTTAPVQTVLARPIIDNSGQLLASHHVVPDHWVLESNGGAMGESLSLMARLLFPDAPQPELRLLAEASQSEAGAGGMLSTLGADVMNMRSPAVPLGHITLSHLASGDAGAPRQHLARALIEGCASALRANLEKLETVLSPELPADRPSHITLCGGLSRGNVFGQVLANILARDVQIAQTHETSALGAALCASLGAGAYPDFASACQALCSPRETLKPQQQHIEVNGQLFDTWSRFHAQAATSTAPIAADHLLPRVLREPDTDDAAATDRPPNLHALVSAAFDPGSLTRLGEDMSVEYASFREEKRLLTGPDLVTALSGKQVFITEVDVVDVNALRQLPDLRVIAACRGDAVNVDVEACTAFGIPVLYAPGRNAIAVADLTVGLMISLARKLPAASRFLAEEDCNAGNMGKMGQAFNQLQGQELWHKTIGLIGLGAVGRAVAARLAGFEVQILVADPYVSPEQAALAGCSLTDLDSLLRDSDFVSVHAAVTAQTTGMIGTDEFAKMKPGACFINTARAALVDEQALISALQNNQLAGAALDTFAMEPPGHDHPLVQHPNVITTPHCAGNTREVANHQGNSVSEALVQLLDGQTPHCVLNPQTLANFSWRGPKPVPDEATLQQLSRRGGPAVSDLQRNASTQPEQPAPVAGQIMAPPSVIEKMSAIVQTFCAGLAADPAIITFSTNEEVTLQFTVYDLGLAFYLCLDHGRVTSAPGAPDAGAEVQLQMRAEILDGMFTGSIDAMECAMNGDIAFMGDAGKAMTLQHLRADMERLYTQARVAVGDPGDLGAIPRPGIAADTAVQSTSGDVRDDLIAIMHELYAAGVITATGGNISVRIPGHDNEVWITPSRLFKGDLKPEAMVRINLEGESLDTGARSPSSEWCMHTQILSKKHSANAVIHAHAPNATILANAGLPFLPISSEAAFFGDIPRVPFLMPGAPELAEAVADAMDNEWAALMINHGLIVAGRSLRSAADMVEIIERSAEVILGCYAVGKEPPVLPEDAVARFREMGEVVA